MELLTEDYLSGITLEELEALIDGKTLNEADIKKVNRESMKRLKQDMIEAGENIGKIAEELRDKNEKTKKEIG